MKLGGIKRFPQELQQRILSLCLNCVISWFNADLQTRAPGADCLQKAEVDFIGNAPFLFTSANIFSAPGNMRLCLAGVLLGKMDR